MEEPKTISEREGVISDLVKAVVGLCSPLQIFLVSEKKNNKGELTALKLCIIVSDDIGYKDVETKLLIEIDSDIPCDYIVYNVSDWNGYIEDDSTFAYRVDTGGEVLYVKG